MPKKKFYVKRKKVCKFTAEGIEYIDYKDLDLLRQFVPVSGKILPPAGCRAPTRSTSAS